MYCCNWYLDYVINKLQHVIQITGTCRYENELNVSNLNHNATTYYVHTYIRPQISMSSVYEYNDISFFVMGYCMANNCIRITNGCIHN